MKHFLNWFKKKISFQALVRFFADAILVNLAIITSLAGRLLWIIGNTKPEVSLNVRLILLNYLQVYQNNAWLLTLICLVVFSLSGFYTYGRFYRGRYKVLIVIQAVSLAYIIFGFLTYLAQSNLLGNLKDILNFPRGALILAWGLSLGMLILARVWSDKCLLPFFSRSTKSF